MSKPKRPLQERMADLAAQAGKLAGEAFSQGNTKQATVCQQFSRSLYRTIPEVLWPVGLMSNPDTNPAILSDEEKAWQHFDKKHGLSTDKRVTFKTEDDGGLLAPNRDQAGTLAPDRENNPG